MNGTIFSIEEFSTFDGPGVRCTVFLKGCPLRCQWCHNPEGQLFQPQILRSPNGCIQCGSCSNTRMTKESIPLCPQHLYRICGETISPEKLVERLSDKFWMLNTASGGITFSGGEPLSQPEFLDECLSLLKSRVHRAIQTSGYTDKNTFYRILKNTDYVLFDLKLIDSEKHKHFTGVDNTTILNNYKTLASSGVPFVTRIPLIPGVNDTAENLTATANFISQLGVKQIDLLPYNRAAGAKYKSIGRLYSPDFNENQAPQIHEDIFEAFNIEVKVL